MKPWLRSWAHGLFDTLYPPRCMGCDRLDPGPFCPLCAVAVEEDGPFSLWPFVRAHAAFRYGGSVAECIRRFKYDGRWWLAEGLAAFLPQVSAHASVPVPIYRDRAVRRGYNQSALLAERCSAPLRLALRRVGGRSPQVGRSGRDRWVDPPRFTVIAPVRDQDVVLVDDVVTTGATARAAGEALLKAGARSVSLLVVARTESPHEFEVLR